MVFNKVIIALKFKKCYFRSKGTNALRALFFSPFFPLLLGTV